MIVRRFLLWCRHAPASHRAEAVGALVRAFLSGELSPTDRAEAETALTAMLDDPSPLVRHALAEALAPAADAPRHVVVTLASDTADVALPVLARSPLLADGDLVDCVALGDARVQVVIAGRPVVSRAVSAALAEIAAADALVTLALNDGADIADFSLVRMVVRHGADGALRDALLARPDLPVEVAQSLAATLADALGGLASEWDGMSPGRLARVTRDARDRATVVLAAQAGADDQARLVAHLRRSGQLTPTLILRALLSGGLPFAEAAFADLARYPRTRVAAALIDRRGGGFRALYARTGLPASLRPAFEASLAALASGARCEPNGRLSRRLVGRALDACDAIASDEAGRLVGLLRRFESEAALADAREKADAMADDAALAIVLEHAPRAVLTDGSGEPGRIAA